MFEINKDNVKEIKLSNGNIVNAVIINSKLLKDLERSLGRDKDLYNEDDIEEKVEFNIIYDEEYDEEDEAAVNINENLAQYSKEFYERKKEEEVRSEEEYEENMDLIADYMAIKSIDDGYDY